MLRSPTGICDSSSGVGRAALTPCWIWWIESTFGQLDELGKDICHMTQVGASLHEIVRHDAVASRKGRLRTPLLTATLAMIALGVAAGCGGGGGTGAPSAPSGTISPLAQAYLNDLLSVMEAHSINRLTINWNTFRAGVMAAAGQRNRCRRRSRRFGPP